MPNSIDFKLVTTDNGSNPAWDTIQTSITDSPPPPPPSQPPH